MAVALRGAGVSFCYRTHDGATARRRVEPLRVVHSGNRRWYLVAWDTDRDGWRTFRVDRIEGRITADAHFDPRPPPDDLDAFVSEGISSSPYRTRIRARIEGTKAELVERVPPWCGALEEDEDGRCILVTGGHSLDAIVCQVVAVGAEFELLDAPELKAHHRSTAARLARGAGSTESPRRSTLEAP